MAKGKLSNDFLPLTGGTIVANPGAQFLSADFVGGSERILVTYIDSDAPSVDGRTQYGDPDRVAALKSYEILFCSGGDRIEDGFDAFGSFVYREQVFVAFVTD